MGHFVFELSCDRQTDINEIVPTPRETGFAKALPVKLCSERWPSQTAEPGGRLTVLSRRISYQ
ncbi:hypothetical protein J6590_057096 [Homalodisca vitripennis]|nr:hypothetical protein J6590_057096 [Homalodisca vitripennis]